MYIRQSLEQIYRRLLDRYGLQHWWPADEPFEVIIGAILTQSAAWANVEQAIINLKEAGALNPATLNRIPIDDLARFIHPSGYYNAKARKIKAFVERLGASYGGSLEGMLALDIDALRRELLSIYGIGQETADSIILYAARKPIFVIDAYTRRIMSRIGLTADEGNYAALQALFMENLPSDEKLYNEYHALLVRHGKEACKTSPLCHHCCLSDLCQF
ncbi:MAG: endonuclease III domain-containing protein [Dehalococcoidia bacterium]|nr:Endonuclease III [Chloroflexota bacterium]MBT9161522.1 Endonuclease III [Chloroflexota bacterium]